MTVSPVGVAAGLVLTLALLSGCGGDDETDDTTSALSAPTGIALGDTTTPAGPGTTAPPRLLPDTIVLSGNGVNDYALGAPQVDLNAMLTPLLGEPDVQPADCAGGSDTALVYPAGLTLYFGAGSLSGWVLASPRTDASGTDAPTTDPGSTVSVPLQTDRGVTVGDTVAELQAAHTEGFQWVADSTLGTEFYIGSGFPYLGGLASGEERDAVVEVLWGADSCAAR